MELSLEDYNKKINHAKAYASAILDNLDPRLKYHSKQHTIAVFRIAMILAEKEGLSLEEKLLLSIAALFHDTGFLHQYQ
ncbi:MAG: HD domain-containing protein, partial [Candidatus Woesearchaeota archaeon]